MGLGGDPGGPSTPLVAGSMAGGNQGLLAALQPYLSSPGFASGFANGLSGGLLGLNQPLSHGLSTGSGGDLLGALLQQHMQQQQNYASMANQGSQAHHTIGLSSLLGSAGGGGLLGALGGGGAGAAAGGTSSALVNLLPLLIA